LPFPVEFCGEKLGESFQRIIFKASLKNPVTQVNDPVKFRPYVLDVLSFPGLGPVVGLIIGADAITKLNIDVNDFAE